jgi:hypothetical protein
MKKTIDVRFEYYNGKFQSPTDLLNKIIHHSESGSLYQVTMEDKLDTYPFNEFRSVIVVPITYSQSDFLDDQHIMNLFNNGLREELDCEVMRWH